MAILVINSHNLSSKLKDFSFACNKCGSNKVTLDIDWAAYPSAAWCRITVICDACKQDEEIYDAG